jgi:hypothetical protein
MEEWYPKVKEIRDSFDSAERFLADLKQILPKNLADKLTGYVKQHRDSFARGLSWKTFLDEISDEELTILCKAIKQLESREAPTPRTPVFKDVPIRNSLTLDAIVAEGGREYAKKNEAVKPGVAGETTKKKR